MLDDANMEKHKVCTLMKYLFLERNDDTRDFLRHEGHNSRVCSCLFYGCKVTWWICTRAIVIWWLALIWITGNFRQETVKKVNKCVMSDQRLSVGFITTSVGISTGSLYSILTENLLMKKVSARLVPQVLSDVQRANPVKAPSNLLRLFNNNPINFVSMANG